MKRDALYYLHGKLSKVEVNTLEKDWYKTLVQKAQAHL